MEDGEQRRERRTAAGDFADPDLTPVMNLVCVLIPLVLWTTTWVTFGEITAVRGNGEGSPHHPAETQQKLRLVAVMTQGSITLMADRAVAGEAMPDETAAGAKGRIDIPHVGMTLEQIRKEGASCTASPDADFDDCAYWRYLEHFVGVCYGESANTVKVPDLKAFNLALRGIKDRVGARFTAGLDDQDQLNVKSEDGVPYCRIVGLMDFARFRRPEYDWREDEAFRAGVDAALERGTTDPLLDPASWNDAMRRELLFPIVAFVN
jgi:hypothetical protein